MLDIYHKGFAWEKTNATIPKAHWRQPSTFLAIVQKDVTEIKRNRPAFSFNCENHVIKDVTEIKEQLRKDIQIFAMNYNLAYEKVDILDTGNEV